MAQKCANLYWATACCTVINLGADYPALRPPTRSDAADGSPMCKVFLPNTKMRESLSPLGRRIGAAHQGQGC